jgi:hypothetical protein
VVYAEIQPDITVFAAKHLRDAVGEVAQHYG